MAKIPKKSQLPEATEPMTTADPLAALKDSRKKRACLMIIFGDDVGRKYWIDKDVTVVGRERAQSDFWVHSEKLSRKHCAILHKAGKYFLKDFGSTNGTYVNGKKVTDDIPIKFGDKIQCGNIIFQFVSEASVESILVDRLKEDAYRDSLTQVYNKKILQDVEKELFGSAKKGSSNLGVIMFDIDHFKKVNDTYGHLFGDQVLSRMAKEIRTNVVRAEDVVVRFGGEEFLVIVPLTSAKTCQQLGERIRAQVEGLKFEHEKNQVSVTVSVGVKCWDPTAEPDIQTLTELIEEADQALYESKQGGRNKVTLAK